MLAARPLFRSVTPSMPPFDTQAEDPLGPAADSRNTSTGNEVVQAGPTSGPGTSPRGFATTSWSLVAQAAGKRELPTVAAALQDLCQSYWYPLYHYVRRQGYDPTIAEDLTQGFFTRLLDGDLLGKADANRGRFRSFLLAALQNYLANEKRYHAAEKRGGGRPAISLDFNDAESRYSLEPAHHRTPQLDFEAQWALSVLQLAMTAVRAQYVEQGKEQIFAALQPLLSGETEVTLREISDGLGMSVGAIKVALHRMRERYGQQIRLQVARTVPDPSEVDDELRSLFQLFSRESL